jgi:hypothetical protein
LPVLAETWIPRFARNDIAIWGDNFFSHPLVSTFVFDQNNGEITATESETLLYASRNRHLRTAARNSLPLAEHPHSASAVVDLKDASAHRSVRIRYPPCNGDLSSGESARVTVNLGYAFARRTSRQQDGSATD